MLVSGAWQETLGGERQQTGRRSRRLFASLIPDKSASAMVRAEYEIFKGLLRPRIDCSRRYGGEPAQAGG